MTFSFRHFLSTNGVTNNVIACVVIAKKLSVNIEVVVKMFSISSFALEKALVSGDRSRRNYISSVYSAVF